MLRILVTMFDCQPFIERCLASIASQSIQDFHCYVMDDCSADSSAQLVQDKFGQNDRFTLVRNVEKRWQVGNYQAVLRSEAINNDDICVSVDGDDWLPDANVFDRVVQAYSAPETWITWGSCSKLRHGRLVPGLSRAVKDVTKLRNAPWVTSHLRTWKVFLWRAIRDADLRNPEGEYWISAGDLAFMFPMLEMATNWHALFLSECNYIYNADSPLNDFKSKPRKQKLDGRMIRSMPPYAPLER